MAGAMRLRIQNASTISPIYTMLVCKYFGVRRGASLDATAEWENGMACITHCGENEKLAQAFRKVVLEDGKRLLARLESG